LATAKKIRVGFVSKFFGEDEPHGELLEGVVAHLPRHMFTTIVLHIASPGQSVSPTLARAADEVACCSSARSSRQIL
jgi:hypothetical protein